MVVVAFMAVPSMGQQKDSVFKLDGEIITGAIVEDNPGYNPTSYLKIQIAPNRVLVIHYSDIRVIRRSAKPAH